jgi:hypothetical protein
MAVVTRRSIQQPQVGGTARFTHPAYVVDPPPTGIQRRWPAVVSESATGGTTFIATMPTSLVDGDVIWADITVGAPSGISHPAGWVQAAATGAAGGVIKWAAYHVVTNAAGEPATYTWTGLTAGRITVVAQAYSGVDNTTPIDVAASTATATSGATLDAPTITTVTAEAMLVSGGGQDSSAAGTLVTPPGSMNLVGRWTFSVGKAGADADEKLSAAGATGVRTWTFDSAVLGHVVYLAALRPASGVVAGGAAANPLVVVPAFAWPATGEAQLFAAPSTPAAVVGTSTPAALVVSPPYVPALPSPAQVFVAPDQPGAPAALVVTPPFAVVPVPGADISASQPLGNPAVGSPQPLVVSTAWTTEVPGAILSASPAAPVVSTAVGTPSPYVVTTTWAAKVPGAQLFANPSAPVVSTTATPNALVVTPPPGVVLVPGARLFAGSPNTVSASSLAVSMPFVRLPVPGAWIASNPLVPPAQRTFAPVLVVTSAWNPSPGGALISHSAEPIVAPVMVCEIPRPNTGTTSRPGAGITTFVTATTGRPGSGITVRPNTGETDEPC